jgi:stress response protein YsnF
MLSEREVSAVMGTTAYDADGDKLGLLEHWFSDDRTGLPSWVSVTTGLFGTRQSLVPLDRASVSDGRLILPVTKQAVRSAPDVGDAGHLSPADETRLREHYGLAGDDVPGDGVSGDDVPGDAPGDDGGQPAGHASAPVQDAGTPDPTATERSTGSPASSDGAMTRSEEQLRVSTEATPARRVRLVKYVVTEEVQITVPLRREEIRIEEVPLEEATTSGGSPTAGGFPGAGESLVTDGGGGLPGEIVLHAERPVVGVEVVPTERVRLRTDTVHDLASVTEQVQREQIAVDQHAAPRATS